MAHQVENLPAVQETQEMRIWSLGQENPLEEEWQPTQYSCLKSHRQSSLVGYQSMGSQSQTWLNDQALIMEDSGSVSPSFRRWALLSRWPLPLGQPHMLSLLTIIYPTSGFTTLYYPWPHPSSHGEDFPSRKSSNALKTTFVFNYARCGCSLAWKSWHPVCHGAGSRQLQWVKGRGSARGGARKQRLQFWK